MADMPIVRGHNTPGPWECNGRIYNVVYYTTDMPIVDGNINIRFTPR